jgi:flagellar biosynthesis anti-sigma factor FlgM
MVIEPGKPINNGGNVPLNKVKKAGANKEAVPYSSVTGSNAAQQDEFVLSSGAQQAQQIRKALQSVPDIRTEKVKEIKAKIDNGTYVIDTEKVAEKIIKDGSIDELV